MTSSFVKSIRDKSLAELKAWTGPLVYDALDFWIQRPNPLKPWAKKHRLKNMTDVRAMASPYHARIDPELILLSDAGDGGGTLRRSGGRPDFCITTTTARIADPVLPSGKRRVVYHGSRRHLGWWYDAAYLSCLLHGARLIVSNGSHPAPGHVLLGVRRGRPWISRRWKSNVKAAFALETRLALCGIAGDALPGDASLIILVHHCTGVCTRAIGECPPTLRRRPPTTAFRSRIVPQSWSESCAS